VQQTAKIPKCGFKINPLEPRTYKLKFDADKVNNQIAVQLIYLLFYSSLFPLFLMMNGYLQAYLKIRLSE
jgi:hypothetical protein